MRATNLGFKDPREIIQAELYYPTINNRGQKTEFSQKMPKYKAFKRPSSSRFHRKTTNLQTSPCSHKYNYYDMANL